MDICHGPETEPDQIKHFVNLITNSSNDDAANMTRKQMIQILTYLCLCEELWYNNSISEREKIIGLTHKFIFKTLIGNKSWM